MSDWLFAICPNARHGGPHIGHMWTTMHARYLYNFAKWYTGKLATRWSIDFKWGVIFDKGSILELENEFLEMFKWWGWPPEFVYRLNEWDEEWANLQSCAHGRTNEDFAAGSCIMRRLLFFNTHNVYWHVRGDDLFILAPYEEADAALFRLRMPVVRYVPIILNAEGEIVGGRNNLKEYLWEGIRKNKPVKVYERLLELGGFTERKEPLSRGIPETFPWLGDRMNLWKTAVIPPRYEYDSTKPIKLDTCWM